MIDFKTSLINYKEKIGFVGTSNFVSINTHKGIQQSRRDDMEAIGYMLIYFIRGDLPWTKIK